MRFIAHRGNVDGAEPGRENAPEYLNAALARGFDVETDVVFEDRAFWLGHDRPAHRVELGFLLNRRVWAHCKTPATLAELAKYRDCNAFFQADDAVAVTTRGDLWVHSRCDLAGPRAVRTVIGFEPALAAARPELLGLCSDYVALYQSEWGPAAAAGQGRPFDLLILDIDGVMTDGTKVYGPDGAVLAKRYCDQDFTAIKRFKAAGIAVCFLSGDRTVNEAMARTRGVDFVFARDPQGGLDKSQFLPRLAERYAVPVERMAYVGDDYYDLSIIENLRWTFCPSDAIADVRGRVRAVLPRPSGHGVVAALYEAFREVIPFAYPVDSYAVNPPDRA
jgi:3-deoxy-D-manno-octulosonate 8-phosphate phosphatase (KDO 8-P phosphatase)